MNFLRAIFGVLNISDYFRHFICSIVVTGMFYYIIERSPNGFTLNTEILLMLNLLLYPYCRFLYHKAMAVFVGEHHLKGNVITTQFTSIITVTICWLLSSLIAPIGLSYLYFSHCNGEKKYTNQE